MKSDRTGLMYEPDETPREINGRPVLAFAPVLSYTPHMDTVPSGNLARVIVGAGPMEFDVLSVAWQVDSGTWLHDGTQPGLHYAAAMVALGKVTIRAGEFANSI